MSQQYQDNLSVLPLEWIERIFTVMAHTYGNRFVSMWAGMDMQSVKLHWAEKLGGFRNHPNAIKAALEALGDQNEPPSLSTFIQLCRNAAKRSKFDPSALEHKPMSKADALARISELKERMKCQNQK